MELTPKQKSIIEAKRCPYCGSSTKVVSEEFIYGRSYRGRSMVCCNNYPQCDAYVGCHDSGEPLGRLAKRTLRKLKSDAHAAFDPIWQMKHLDRHSAYEELADHLGIPDEFTHIGYFSEDTCLKVINWANDKIKEFTS